MISKSGCELNVPTPPTPKYIVFSGTSMPSVMDVTLYMSAIDCCDKIVSALTDDSYLTATQFSDGSRDRRTTMIGLHNF